MNYLGIDYEVKNMPELDPDFIPFGVWARAFLAKADHSFDVAIERENGNISVFHSYLRGEGYEEANIRYAERYVKLLLYAVGGFRVYISGCDKIAEKLQKIYSDDGERAFDAGLMKDVYERPFEIVISDKDSFPKAAEKAKPIGGHLEGCRIGFDAGGSDRKVSAVIDGETVYSEEVVWFPKLSEDPDYQYQGIVEAFKTAASKMPRVDAIGVSSAGVFVGNSPMVSSLFIKVPKERRGEVKSVYVRAAKEIGDVPLVAANDGDVTALAGAMSLESGAVMGIAMGTSEAVGYVSPEGKILGWLNELAFAPLDLSPDAEIDEWSGDRGAGCKYLSQDAVSRLAVKAGIAFEDGTSPAEKLKIAQHLADEGKEEALEVFRSIGSYMAYAAVLYSKIYDIRNLIVLGRVASGTGGDIVIEECKRILKEEYPEISNNLEVMLPDDNMRRVGQSIAAASLPEV